MKQSILLLFIVLALLLQSCSTVAKWDTFPIAVNANDEADLAVIDYYNETFGAEIFIDDENGVKIERVESIDCDNCLALTTFENRDITNARIEILDNMQDRLYFCVMAHELGHVLTGSEHLESGLMAVNPVCPFNQEDTIDDDFFEYVSEMYNF